MDRNDHEQAARLFQQVVDQAPQFSPALRRLGGSLAAGGQREAGLKFAARAVQLERSPENLITMAEVLAYQPNGQQPSNVSLEQAFRLAQEANTKARSYNDVDYPALTAHLALRLQWNKEFREAARDLVTRFPDEMVTHYVSAIAAAMDGAWERAETEIKEAQNRGLPSEATVAFLNSGVARQARIRRLMRYTAYAMAIWIAGLLLLFVAGKRLSYQTLLSIENADPNGIASARELLLRRVYRMLIVFAGSYYYFSLPFVIVSVVGGTALVVYFFMWIGRLPVGLLLALAAGALFTVIKCIQTLFVRVPFEAPGRSLEPTEAPGLWSLTRQVAQAIGTRPVDEVRVTPGTEMAVYERGTRRERREDRARRVLLMGVGLIEGFRQAPFCAVLAHEYGHFAHRDTAGGELALRVYNDMMRFAVVLARNGQAVWWNLAWHFLRAYAFLFRRITHGATRLQEVLADRVAASQYGTANFEEGLRHVVRRSLEFNATVNEEVQDALQNHRALRNLYSLAASHTSELKQEIEDALSRPTSEDDTHPGPEERFRLLNGVHSVNNGAADGVVWELFEDRDALTREMTSQVESQLTALHEPELVTATA